LRVWQFSDLLMRNHSWLPMTGTESFRPPADSGLWLRHWLYAKIDVKL
jgi:hypothetical protein